MPLPILEARDLQFAWPGAARAAELCGAQRPRALDGVTLALRPGARLALLGANGSGKSTLLLHLNGTLRPDSGAVLHDGAPLDYSRRGLLALRQRVALVFQDPDDQLFAGTLAQDVSFGPLNLGLPAGEVARRVAASLAAVGLENLGELPLHMLSHGQRKRAAIAGALAMRPRVLLLDEPTAGLDPEGISSLLAHLDDLNAQGIAILFSTHHLALARAWADEAAIMTAGRIHATGDSATLLADDALLRSARLLFTAPSRPPHPGSPPRPPPSP
jgi:cobalt/nickel transport system ATP-binding protein